MPDKPALTNSDWTEIYHAVDDKIIINEEFYEINSLKALSYQLKSIRDKIGPDGENMWEDSVGT